MKDRRAVFNIEALEASQYLNIPLFIFIKAVNHFAIPHKINGCNRLYCRNDLNELKELLEKDKEKK